jgi:hypothetical protein
MTTRMPPQFQVNTQDCRAGRIMPRMSQIRRAFVLLSDFLASGSAGLPWF